MSGASVSKLSVDLPWWKCPCALISFVIKDLVVFLPGSLISSVSVDVCGCLLLVLSGKSQGNCTKKRAGDWNSLDFFFS